MPCWIELCVRPLSGRARCLLACAAVAALSAYCFAGWPISSRDVLAAEQPSSEAKPPSSDKLDGEFKSKLVPFVQMYCVECHSGDEAEAGIAFDKYTTAESFLKSRKLWRTARDKLRGREMPPADHDVLPKPEEADRIAAWIDSELANHLCAGPVNPGRVTIRRLNRAEYNNTIRDLVGIDFQPADDFPSDDVGYGFDNIGDVLAMPPILLEKYLAAAEKIMEAAIVVDDPGHAPAVKFAGKDLEGAGNPTGEDARVLTSNGEATATLELPEDGEYLISITAAADQAGRDSAEMSVKLDQKELKMFEVANQRHNPIPYKLKMRLEAGRKKLAIAFLNDFFKTEEQVEKGERPGDRNLYVSLIEVQGPLGLDPAKLPESHKKIMIATPPPERPVIIRPSRRGRPRTPEEREAAEKARREARQERERRQADNVRTRADSARKIIENFATRAFRRPVEQEEVNRLAALWQMAEKDGQPFERGIQIALSAVLVSPHFLYRIEGEPSADSPDGIYTLNEHELATRLSYFLWSSMPDDELRRAADQGVLRKNGNLEQQIHRMLRDPKAQALVDNFAGQWLQTRRLDSMAMDGKLFPGFDDSLRTAMKQETELFFATVMAEDRSILEFLDSDYTFLNERLAKHYGIDGVSGDHFRKVQLTSDQPAIKSRGGILTMASILTITSNPTRTSPVKRGKWVMETILGTPPPPPPPDVPELGEGGELTGSLKQRMEQHRENPACASCHTRMDAIGFGLENFNAIGAWREKDGPHAIDPTGELTPGKKFSGARDLKEILKSQRDLFVRCVTDRMLTYALGRGLEEYDECTVDRIATAVAKNEYKFSSLVIEIAKSDAFQKKKGIK